MDDDFRSAMSDVAPLGEKAQKKAQTEELKLEAKKEIPREVSLTQLERRYAALGIERTPKVDPNPLTLAEVPQLEPREARQCDTASGDSILRRRVGPRQQCPGLVGVAFAEFLPFRA